ncbi:MAG: hypothetical protein VKL59_17070 [Nostocaceae cyanobacterium]|nr:hypothetical protein [Nostocaceae cyanobacterium]
MLGFVKNLGKKNNNGFFMELKDDAPTSGEAKATTPAPPTPAPVAEPAKAEAVKPSKEKKAKPAQEKKAKAQKVEAAPAPVPAKPQPPAETNFATKYLAPSVSGSNGRRRPGPSMNSYLDMARQAKVPNSAK